jgi:hypothetical protein
VPNVEVFAQGHGLVQVERALQACLVGGPRKKHLDLAMEVRVASRPAPTACGVAHGIYLREPFETVASSEHVVEVHPLFELDLGAWLAGWRAGGLAGWPEDGSTD